MLVAPMRAASVEGAPAITAIVPAEMAGAVPLPVMIAVRVVECTIVSPVAVVERAIRAVIITIIVAACTDGDARALTVSIAATFIGAARHQKLRKCHKRRELDERVHTNLLSTADLSSNRPRTVCGAVRMGGGGRV
jgi:hypothetical protein